MEPLVILAGLAVSFVVGFLVGGAKATSILVSIESELKVLERTASKEAQAIVRRIKDIL